MDTPFPRKSFSELLSTCFFYLIDASCVACGNKVFSAELCSDCNHFNPVFNSKGSYFCGFEYDEIAKKLVHTIKHEASFQNLKLLLPLLTHAIQKDFFGAHPNSILIPVPLSEYRFQKRGFNQSEWLANQLAQIYDLRIETRGLIKKFETPPQSTLKAKDRKTNLSEAFAWNREIPLPSSVCLIDDITTTGETLKACRKVLKEWGVSQIVSWALFKVAS